MNNIILKSYTDLLEYDEDLAKELLENVGEGDWQQERIYYYEDEEEFAEYELTEGWYASLGIGLDKDYNGAPNLMNYIDLIALGGALVATWDKSCNFKSEQGEILTTSCGW